MGVSAMSLSEREQQALQSIEDRLADADPRLASMLAAFTRLTEGEAPPTRENAGTAPGSRPHRSVPSLRVRPRWQHAWALLWLGTVAALIALALVLGQGSGGVACAPLTIACARQAPGRATGTAALRAAPAHSRESPARLSASAAAGTRPSGGSSGPGSASTPPTQWIARDDHPPFRARHQCGRNSWCLCGWGCSAGWWSSPG